MNTIENHDGECTIRRTTRFYVNTLSLIEPLYETCAPLKHPPMASFLHPPHPIHYTCMTWPRASTVERVNETQVIRHPVGAGASHAPQNTSVYSNENYSEVIRSEEPFRVSKFSSHCRMYRWTKSHSTLLALARGGGNTPINLDHYVTDHYDIDHYVKNGNPISRSLETFRLDLGSFYQDAKSFLVIPGGDVR